MMTARGRGPAERNTSPSTPADRVRTIGDGLARPDHRLRRVPRPQVRPVHAARLLQLRRVLRRHPRKGRLEQRRPLPGEGHQDMWRTTRASRSRTWGRSWRCPTTGRPEPSREAALVPADHLGARRREIRILPRGNWLDESGEVVPPAMPDFLPGRDRDTAGAAPHPPRPGPVDRRTRTIR